MMRSSRLSPRVSLSSSRAASSIGSPEYPFFMGEDSMWRGESENEKEFILKMIKTLSNENIIVYNVWWTSQSIFHALLTYSLFFYFLLIFESRRSHKKGLPHAHEKTRSDVYSRSPYLKTMI